MQHVHMQHGYNELKALLQLPDTAVQVVGDEPVLGTRFALASTAANVLAAIGVSAADLWKTRGGSDQEISVDLRHAGAALNSFLYNQLMAEAPPVGVRTPGTSVGGILPTADGRYFHIHGSFDPVGMCKALGATEPSREAAAAAVAKWDAQALEDHIAESGHCGAMIRTETEWAQHPHGQALAARPPVEIIKLGDSPPEALPWGDRPLSGIRALDLTRVLAGPTCARTLAEHGAQVMRVGAAHLPTIEHFDRDTGHGKRWTNLNLKEANDMEKLRRLSAEADVFSEGYRPGVMKRFGLSPEALHELRPGIVYVSINCYGHEGPFAERPGWEQLGQSVSGMAAEEGGDGPPRLVPAAACDYTTGYLAALGVLAALKRRTAEGGSYLVRVSLARTGMWYLSQPRIPENVPLPDGPLTGKQVENFLSTRKTDYGQMRHLAPVVQMSETPTRWERPSPRNGSSEAVWVQV
ncbi:MAG: CoA transferase [Proteobacteria bacterium]|jgi:crotonobetainyl-CoA:carnitine CoA-transferase CaiB-like acyl-CoA transferase|nr:CoA transferase [Pseudomonadota bacterium]